MSDSDNRDRIEPCLQDIYRTTIMIPPAIKQCYSRANEHTRGSEAQLKLRTMARHLNAINREIDALKKFLADNRD